MLAINRMIPTVRSPSIRSPTAQITNAGPPLMPQQRRRSAVFGSIFPFSTRQAVNRAPTGYPEISERRNTPPQHWGRRRICRVKGEMRADTVSIAPLCKRKEERIIKGKREGIRRSPQSRIPEDIPSPMGSEKKIATKNTDKEPTATQIEPSLLRKVNCLVTPYLKFSSLYSPPIPGIHNFSLFCLHINKS